MIFNTAMPDWRVGDAFLACSQLQRFRILAIDTELDERALQLTNAVWVVERG